MIYLDNSATTRTMPEAAETAWQYMNEWFFNPAGAYAPAAEAEKRLDGARARMAAVLGAQAEELVFTSGGTESNNMAIRGVMQAARAPRRIIRSSTEHPSVYETMGSFSGRCDVLDAPVDASGAVDVEKLARMLTPDTALLSIMHVNNETGAVNDIPAIYALMKKRAPQALLHVDGVQAFLKVPLASRYFDLYSISGHKFHAPKGVGALYMKKGIRFAPVQTGGGQERSLRSGTSNMPGIMGMDKAVEIYVQNREAYIAAMRSCKLRLAENLLRLGDVFVNGPAPEEGAPHILNLSFMGVGGEVLLHALEQSEIYVSTGSACSARKKGKNRILSAMGITGERQEGALRFSFSPFNTVEEMDLAAQKLEDALHLLRRYKRR